MAYAAALCTLLLSTRRWRDAGSPDYDIGEALATTTPKARKVLPSHANVDRKARLEAEETCAESIIWCQDY